jgi:hypothetical protein
MGMFDNVEYETQCPSCNQPLSGFQSKDGPCELLYLKPEDVNTFYTSCKACGTWVEFKTERRTTLVGIRRVKPEQKAADTTLEDFTPETNSASPTRLRLPRKAKPKTGV